MIDWRPPIRATNRPSGVPPCTPNPFSSNVTRPPVGIYGRHGFNCAFPTLGGVCDCGAIPVAAWTAVRVLDLFTSGRGFTYDLAGMLGDGWYGEAS